MSQTDSEQILAACPDAQWRLLFSLCRWGGLRHPSETLLLRWDDIDWDRGRIHVSSPKTEHHAGHESRIIPLFPELRGPLMEYFEQAEPGTVFVITRYRNPAANHRTQFTRILKRAGLKAWPKLFQNLRSTRETELAEKYPIQVVCAWIGNSILVAKKSYLQVRDSDFDAAVSGDKKALQNPAQSIAESGGNEPKPRLPVQNFMGGNRSQVFETSGLIGNLPNSSDSRHCISTADERS